MLHLVKTTITNYYLRYKRVNVLKTSLLEHKEKRYCVCARLVELHEMVIIWPVRNPPVRVHAGGWGRGGRLLKCWKAIQSARTTRILGCKWTDKSYIMAGNECIIKSCAFKHTHRFRWVSLQSLRCCLCPNYPTFLYLQGPAADYWSPKRPATPQTNIISVQCSVYELMKTW